MSQYDLGFSTGLDVGLAVALIVFGVMMFLLTRKAAK